MASTFPKFGYNPITGEWNDSLSGEFLWSNANLSEAVPDVMTPSTWSLWWIFHYETNPVKFPGNYPLCGNLCGRPYFNSSLLFSVYQAVGRDARKELQNDMIGSASADMDIPIMPFSAFLVYRTVLPGSLKAYWKMNCSRKELAQFIEFTPAWCRATRNRIMEWKDPHSLLIGWRQALKPVLVRACQMLRTVTAGLAEPATPLRQELTFLVGNADANTLLSNLSGASGDLASLGPLLGLSQVAEGRLSREAYLERFGHRGTHEMELSAAGADDDPAWFEKQMAHFSQLPTNVDALLANQRDEQATVWARFASRFPGKAPAIRRRLEKIAAAAKNREAVRSEVTRLARLLRFFLLKAGAVTRLSEEVFFLSLDELAEVLAGDTDSLSRLPARQDVYQRYCALPPYPAIIIGRFDPFTWAADPNRRSDIYDARKTGSARLSSTIKGFAGSAGCVEGIVRRIDCMEDANQIQPGEILVTTITNIGWTPIFPRLAAIVTDVGAPLSHAAIVARELGIPAVVGCGNATMLLKTGDRVRVDGGRGTVEILLG
jgi:phosphohistidine swiveling domain-containing protein